jgi:AhpD family alkylhydroperoxidase
MEPRLSYSKITPEGHKAMSALNRYVEHCGLEPLLLELVKMRASQINGCAYCIDMHSKDARALGESEHRLYALSAWRETPFYSERERAALLWTEELTLLSQTHATDAVYEEVHQHFSDEEMVNLTWAIVVINGWNRLAVGLRSVPGIYQSTKKPLA